MVTGGVPTGGAGEVTMAGGGVVTGGVPTGGVVKNKTKSLASLPSVRGK